MKKTTFAVVASIALAAWIIADEVIASRRSRNSRLDAMTDAYTKAELKAVDEAEAAMQEMIAEGLYEDRSVADIERDFNSLRILYRAK